MDLTQPMAAIVPALEAAVLSTLARTTRPLTGREVHRLGGTGSESGVRLILARLVDSGLVHATSAGRATLYVANREHLAWPSVQALTRLRHTFFDELGCHVAQWSDEPLTVAVFGSAARGDGRTASDIDVLVVRSGGDDERWIDRIDALREQVTAWTGNPCQVYELTSAQFREYVVSAEPILTEWQRDAVVVHGHSIDELSRKGAA